MPFYNISIIFLNIPVRFIKQLLLFVQLIFQQHPAQRLCDLTLAGNSFLPTGEADISYDLVNIGDDAFDNYGSLSCLGFIE